MTAPFDAVEKDGRIYGRGALDMKSGLAAAAAALIAVSREAARLHGEVVFAAVIDEEDLSLGTQHFLKNWPGESAFDLALVVEPTDLKICTAHKGFAWLEVTTHGVAAHGSRPTEGIDAVRAMGEVLRELDTLDHQLQAEASHPLLGTGSLHASIIQGGREWSSYPDRCVLMYERRTIPGQTDTHVEMEMRSVLDAISQRDPNFHASGRLVFSRAPLQVSREQVHVQRFFQTAKRRLPDWTDWGGASFWTDAALLSEAGIPALVFGPRGTGLHSLEEYVISADVVACAEVIYQFLLGE
jgi:acetylornithine deacetylase